MEHTMLRLARLFLALSFAGCAALASGALSPSRADDAVGAAILSEEAGSQVRRDEGAVTWTAEPATGGLRADVSTGTFGLTLTLHRNADAAIPASHVAMLEFRPSSGFAGGAISVSGILMKAHLGAKLLAGRVVKIGDRSSRIELADDAAADAQNRQLLNDTSWLTVVIVYGDGRHAELMLFKGERGREVFASALAGWN
jgi:hypothetical protein